MRNFPSCAALHQEACVRLLPEFLGPKMCDSVTVMVPPQLAVSQWSALTLSLCLCPCWKLKCVLVNAVEKNYMNRTVDLFGASKERSRDLVTWTSEFMFTLENSGVIHVFLYEVRLEVFTRFLVFETWPGTWLEFDWFGKGPVLVLLNSRTKLETLVKIGVWVGEVVACYHWFGLFSHRKHSSEPKCITKSHLTMFSPLIGQMCLEREGEGPEEGPSYPNIKATFTWHTYLHIPEYDCCVQIQQRSI